MSKKVLNITGDIKRILIENNRIHLEVKFEDDDNESWVFAHNPIEIFKYKKIIINNEEKK